MYTVFLVDDEPLICEGLQRLLDWPSLGYRIVGSASSAEAAMEEIRRLTPDVVITDVRLTGMSGIDMIRRLRIEGYQGQFIVISGHADFTYAQGAIRYGAKSYLLKPIDERELAGELYAVKKILQAEGGARDTASTHGPQIELQWQQFLQRKGELPELPAPRALPAADGMLIAVLRPLGHFSEALDAGRLARIARACMPETGMQWLYITLHQAVLWSEADVPALDACLDQLMLRLQAETQAPYGAAIGPRVSDPTALPDAYDGAQALLDRRFLYGGKGVIRHRMPAPEAPDAPPNAKMAEKLADATLYQAREALCELLAQWRDRFIRAGGEEIGIKVAYSNLLTQVFTALDARCPVIPAEVYDRQALIEKIYLAPDIETLTRQFSEHMLALSEALTGILPDSSMQHALHYIEHNYRSNLSVESVAQALHYNAVYFGRKFKAFAGVSFTTYLENLRMEKAKALLLQDYRIYQIAEMVGIANVDYFSEKFKHHVGVPPTTYRQRQQGEDGGEG